ncbi:MAG: fatty acid desaturase [Pikeienuella sp.]
MVTDEPGSPSFRRFRRHSFDPAIRAQLRVLNNSKDNWHGLLALAQGLIVITIAILLSLWSPYFYPLTLILVGSRHRALGTLQHEASHFTLCRSRILTRTIGMLAGWSIFQTLHAYRVSHVEAHHKYLGDETRDPNLRAFVRQGLFEADTRNLIRDHFLPLVLGLKSWANFKNLVLERLMPRNWSALPPQAKLEYLGFIAFWAALIGVILWNGLILEFLVFWLIPYFTAFQAVNWVIELAEHFPLVRLYDSELYMTRNRQGPWIERVLFEIHGENWHLVHHLSPGTPFWKLPEAHRIMMGDPVYAKANTWAGGLVFRGPNGEASMASMLAEQLKQAQNLSVQNRSDVNAAGQ